MAERVDTARGRKKDEKKKAGRITSASPYFRNLLPFKRTVILLYENKWLLLVICAIMAMSLAYVNYKDSKLHASATLAYNYQESSNGLYPNKTRLNLSEFKCAEVLDRAIELAGLQGELTSSELSQAITVNPSQVKYIGTNTENYYVATSYYIYLDMTRQMPRIECGDLLSLVYIAYSDYFFKNYTENRAILTSTMTYSGTEEYYVTSDLLNARASQLLRYLDMRINSASDYTNNECIIEYKSLVQQLHNFVNYDLEKYRNFIIQTGIARDKSAYAGVLTYANMQKTYEYNKLMDAYTANKNGLDMYDITMSATVLIPTLRKDNNYYMGRTNSRMDYFTKDADAFLASSSLVKDDISLNDRLLAALRQNDSTQEDTAVADGLIASMYKTLSELSDSINVVDEEFVLDKTRDYLKFSRHYQSFLDTVDYKRILIVCAVFLALTALAVFYVQSSAKWKKPLTPGVSEKSAGED